MMSKDSKRIKTIFYYSMIILLGIVFVIVGFIFQNDGVIFHRMIRAGLGSIGVGIIFLLSALKFQRNEKNDKMTQRLNNATFDERNQFISGKAANITIDVMQVFSLLTSFVSYFFGMNNYASVLIGYIVINNILQLGISIYLRHKF